MGIIVFILGFIVGVIYKGEMDKKIIRKYSEKGDE